MDNRALSVEADKWVKEGSGSGSGSGVGTTYLCCAAVQLPEMLSRVLCSLLSSIAPAVLVKAWHTWQCDTMAVFEVTAVVAVV